MTDEGLSRRGGSPYARGGFGNPYGIPSLGRPVNMWEIYRPQFPPEWLYNTLPPSPENVCTPLSLPPARLQDHHIFPQTFRRYFEQNGINIDQHTITLGSNNHLRGIHGRGIGSMPGRWNDRWRNFIENNPNASQREIYQFGGRLMDEYGLTNYRIHPYRE